MNFSDLNYKNVIFKQCPVHTELCYAGDKCPVCVLQDRVDELEFEIQEIQDPL